MQASRLGRRAFLATGTGLAAALAGCAGPRTDRSMPGDSSAQPSADAENVADGSAYTDVYEATIDAVALVQVDGVVNPRTGEEGRGSGSAFCYDGTHLVTNHHVVAGGDAVDLRYVTGDWSSTTVVGTDPYSDLAVLEADHVPSSATSLPVSDERPVVGQQVLAIGNPLGLEGSMTRGIVSGVNRSYAPRGAQFSISNVVQTDAAVNPGNSGGPLVDMEGAVVGVVHATGGENVGFAISAALTRRVVPSLIESGGYRHAYLGIELLPVDRRIAAANDLSEASGILVVGVVPDGPADGVLRGSDGGNPPVGGDVIRRIDGEAIPDQHALSTYLALETSPGETVTVDVVRDGEETTVDVTLGERPMPDGDWAPG